MGAKQTKDLAALKAALELAYQEWAKNGGLALDDWRDNRGKRGARTAKNFKSASIYKALNNKNRFYADHLERLIRDSMLKNPSAFLDQWNRAVAELREQHDPDRIRPRGVKRARAGFAETAKRWLHKQTGHEEPKGAPGFRIMLGGMSFTGLNFTKTEGDKTIGIDLSGAVLVRTRFAQCDLREANMSGADVSGADFGSATLDFSPKFDFTEPAKRSNTQWPDRPHGLKQRVLQSDDEQNKLRGRDDHKKKIAEILGETPPPVIGDDGETVTPEVVRFPSLPDRRQPS